MSRNANAAPSPHLTDDRPRRILRIIGLALLMGVAALYLGGVLFQVFIHASPRDASPLTLVRYGYYYRHLPPIRHRLVQAAAFSLVAVLTGIILLLRPPPRSLHGDARFATRREIRAAGLIGNHGILLGRIGRRYLSLRGQQGVALAAPPRAGKGTGIVIPNLLNWPDSVICIDIKKENWQRTAGYRSRYQPCFLFDPFAEDGQTARWNPFFYVAEDPDKRVNDLQRVAEMLYPDPLNGDPFWNASARSLFLGIALYLFETPSLPKTIGEVLRQGMASDEEGFGHHWHRLIEGRAAGRFPLSATCVRALYDIIDLAPVTASSIRKTFTSRLDLWLNPILDAATAENDFDLRELRRTRMSIYVGVNPDDLHRLRPVLALFFQQAIGLQTRELPEHNPQLQYRLLLLLDEFAALGRIPIMAEAISYLPGYNLRVVLVIQTPAQLREVYGTDAADIMLMSLAARIVFAPKDFADAQEISAELGNQTVRATSWTKPAASLGSQQSRRSRSINISEQSRALLLPQELKELSADDALIFCEGVRPIRCWKIRYFRDRRFKSRLLPVPVRIVPRAVASVSQCAGNARNVGALDLRNNHDRPVGDAHAGRAATAKDLDPPVLDKVAGDFSPPGAPAPSQISSEQIHAMAHELLETLRTPER